MNSSLKTKTIRALSWSFVEAVGLRGVQFVIGIVLARILMPEQFGLIGMLAIFMAVSQSFVNSGFGAALIQKQDATETDVCSIFYFNIVVGVLAALLLCLIAPWVAEFYEQPILTDLLRVLSSILVINSFGLIQMSLLSKRVDFKTSTKVSLSASLLSGIVGIGMALSGYEVWSIVGQQISSSFINTTLLWVLNTWRPKLLFSFASLKELFGFGSRLLVSGVMTQIFDNLYLLVIGKLFSATDLGFYTRARNLQQTPSQTIGRMVSRVTFPIFATIQDDLPRVKRNMKKAITTLALFNFPVMIGLAVVGRPLVLVLLTDKWEASIPYFKLLCVVGILFPIHLINLNVIQALGRSDLFLRLEIIKKVLTIINIAIAWRWGITALIIGMIAVSFVSFFLNSYYNRELIQYATGEQILDLAPYCLTAIAMGVFVMGIGLLPIQGNLLLLICQSLSGAGFYVAACRLLRLSAFDRIYKEGIEKYQSARGRLRTDSPSV